MASTSGTYSEFSARQSARSPVTHPSLHIRDAHDAHVVLEAVRLNLLPLVTRRLSSSERGLLASGHVYVWEEAEDDGGLLRWTDGRKWSQSRMRGDYLFYEEKIEITQAEKDEKAARRAHRASDPGAMIPTPNRRRDRPSKPDGLTKQTYSALVYLPGTSKPRKWHVVAYFSGDDYSRLPVIASYPYLRTIRVPEGVYMSSKANGTRGEPGAGLRDFSAERFSESGSPTTPQGSYGFVSPTSPTLSSPVSDRAMLHSPSYTSHREHLVNDNGALSSSLPTGTSLQDGTRLPPLNAVLPRYPQMKRRYSGEIAGPDPGSHPSDATGPLRPKYTPLTDEDKRVLGKLRVVL